MSEPAKAVFLSYAREDADAARRIAEALRGFGVEVWFDQSELRGGDQWDAKIRGQIKACALFLPIISATTQARDEAYFRLEWKLADDRSHLMAPGKPFIVPVAIDDTPDSGATVPESFGRAQWTRLAAGEPTSAFIEQVKRLLDAPRKPALKPDLPRPPTLPPEFKQAARARTAASAGEPASQKKSAFPGWVWGVLAVVVAGVAVIWSWLRQPAAASPPAPRVEAAVTTVKPVPPVKEDKSIAVLPFANLSGEKDSEFFTDGVHEDLLTALAKVRDLKVISRTSVLGYRDTAKRNLRQIAADLGVAHVLEGSVRRAGGKARITVQLINARTDEHLWAETYDRELTDVFAVQSEVAREITSALRANLTAGERALIERRPTQDQQAYELYQRGRALELGINANSAREEYEPILTLYEQALARDPGFALVHGYLSNLNGVMYWFGAVDPTPERRARAQAALAAAERLAPEAPETRQARGSFAYLCQNDWARALQEYRAAEGGLPNDATLQYQMGIAHRRLGQWAEALGRFERSVVLNPQDQSGVTTLVETLSALRRYGRVLELTQRYRVMFPENVWLQEFQADAQYALDGDRSAWLKSRATMPVYGYDKFGLQRAYEQALRDGDLAAADRILADPRCTVIRTPGGAINEPSALARAEVALLRGDPVAARQYAEEATAAFRAGRWSPRQDVLVRLGLARAQACAGQTEPGLRLLGETMEQLARSDKFLVRVMWHQAAQSYAVHGRAEEALACLRELLAGPSLVSPNELLHDPFFARLRTDPRFEAIVRSAPPP